MTSPPRFKILVVGATLGRERRLKPDFVLKLFFSSFLVRLGQYVLCCGEFRRKSASSAQTGSKQQPLKMAAPVSPFSPSQEIAFVASAMFLKPFPIESSTFPAIRRLLVVVNHSVADLSVSSCDPGTQISSSSMFLSFQANEEQCASD